jgi:hypothetical protein
MFVRSFLKAHPRKLSILLFSIFPLQNKLKRKFILTEI